MINQKCLVCSVPKHDQWKYILGLSFWLIVKLYRIYPHVQGQFFFMITIIVMWKVCQSWPMKKVRQSWPIKICGWDLKQDKFNFWYICVRVIRLVSQVWSWESCLHQWPCDLPYLPTANSQTPVQQSCPGVPTAIQQASWAKDTGESL